jgi:DNA-binding IclR family transcriptional regulator
VTGKRIVKRGANRVQSLDRSLDLLEAFTTERLELGLSELARVTGLNKATTYRLASTLVARGFLANHERQYRLGFKILNLGHILLESLDLRKAAHPTLTTLVKGTGETAHLCVLEQGEVVYIDKVDTSQPVRLHSWIGRRAPAHCTAVGKVLLASLPRSSVEEIIREHGLRRFTVATNTDPAELAKHLARIRRQGFAVDNEEIVPGIRCIAAPIFDHAGQVVAAIGIAGPVQRISPGKVRALATSVCDAADTVSQSLGCRPLEKALRNTAARFVPGG